MTSAVRALYAMYLMICWWMMYDFYMNLLRKATLLHEKPFPQFDNLCKIFSKDRAIGHEAIDLEKKM